MRKKRGKATAVLVGGVVHAIGDAKFAFQSVHDEPRGPAWDAWRVWSTYPLPRRITRARRKAEKAKRLKGRTDPLVRLACEPQHAWRSASRTHSAVTCMTCLVVMAGRDR